MRPQEAGTLVEATFNHSYDEGRFRLFARNLFGDLEEKSDRWAGSYVPEAFRGFVSQYGRLGKFEDAEGYSVDVLAVKLKSAAQLERARSAQRNFIARYLNGGRGDVLRDAALVAFYADDDPDWRFSLVRMDYSLDLEHNKLRRDLTPARRYSFLVGPSERTHTAQKQLSKVLTGDALPTLTALEQAFNIETVTKEFFEKYKELFLNLKEALDALVDENTRVAQEFTAKDIDTANFSKRLLGQIVFLYFLQKKGWLGVQRGAAWVGGPKDFLQRLFAGDYVRYGNFFNDILEPLFYEALAVERSEHYYSRFDCAIPFLNGGLFEPIGGYDWVNVDIPLKNELFEDIFGVFDLYNFTVREDEPLDKEVAVDPEMLGKVFENLLEVTDRKSRGAFYTPREIVHYMCRESLINYLDTALNTVKRPLAKQAASQDALFGKPQARQEPLYEEVYEARVPREDIEAFIRLGDVAQEHDATTVQKGKETEAYSFKTPESIRGSAGAIDDALASIKICDPAIGSGAFPVGMMNEIVRTRSALTPYLAAAPLNKGGWGDLAQATREAADRSKSPLSPPLLRGEGNGRTPYDFKRHAIQESIYGVDIDASAVDIAKLRLWLSLVVDEDDFGTIKPLPNLGYKIVEGNSVLSLEGAITDGREMRDLETLKRAYFGETRAGKKQELNRRIDQTLTNIFRSAQDFGSRANFDFRIHFSEVFHQQGGFDVVIGNPPYVRQEALGDLKDLLKKYEAYHGSADLFVYFIELGVKLLKKGGTFAYIVANKWMRANYGKPLRAWLKKQQLLTIIDYGDLPVFETATTYPCILFVGKDKPNEEVQVVKMEELAFEHLSRYVDERSYAQTQKDLEDGGWSLANRDAQKVLDKISKVGVPLEQYIDGKIYRGVLTGLNEAFVIDEATKNKLIAEDPKSAEVIKPFLAGRDIKKFSPPKSKNYLIFAFRRNFDIEEYPAIKKHLSQFKDRLTPKPKGWTGADWQGRKPGSYKWYEIQDAVDYYEEFEKPKIMYLVFQVRPTFTFDSSGTYGNNAIWIIPKDDKFLLGVLNSKIGWFLISNYCTQIQNGYQLIFKYLGRIPIRTIDPSNPSDKQKHDSMVERVETMLALHEQKGAATEQGERARLEREIAATDEQIDTLVYELYDLTDEEIAMVEEAVAG